MSKTHRYFPILLLAVGVGFASAACAPHPYGSVSVRGVYYRDLDRRGYDNGYREGVEEGQNDVRHHRSFSWSRHNEYRHANHGYRREGGDREFYGRSYRQGFEVGYAEAYNRLVRAYRYSNAARTQARREAGSVIRGRNGGAASRSGAPRLRAGPVNGSRGMP